MGNVSDKNPKVILKTIQINVPMCTVCDTELTYEGVINLNNKTRKPIGFELVKGRTEEELKQLSLYRANKKHLYICKTCNIDYLLDDRVK